MTRTTTQKATRLVFLARIGIACVLSIFVTASAAAQSVTLTAIGTPYGQDFDTLANSGTASSVPNGWAFVESGTNANGTYTAGNGGGTAGDTYSFGATSATDRALGGLRSGSLIPMFGASFTNNTGVAVTSLAVGYTGEQWRLGTTGRADRVDFQYSLDAVSLTTGTWADVDALDFSSPFTTTLGARDGNAAGNRTLLNFTITGLSIPNGATFWIRWSDVDVTGADDGLAVDDFSLTPQSAPVDPTLSISTVSILEGDTGTTTFSFNVTLSGPAGAAGVTFDIATGDASATVADNDYVARSIAGATIPSGQMSYAFDVTVNGDTHVESNETFNVTASNIVGATPSSVTAPGNILADDAGPAILTTAGSPHSQNFDALANVGTTNVLLVPGWFLSESGSSARNDGFYAADNGGSTTGDTYSYGAGGSVERAFGTLRSGTLIPTVGALFENQTGVTITRLGVSYTGEQWRLGSAGRPDRLDFQYSLNATSLTSGTWPDVDDLDFASPFTTTAGALDGNSAANRSARTHTIVGLSIPPGASFWIRWNDFDASGADDGLAIDDFSIVPNPLQPSGTGQATPTDLFAGDDVFLVVTTTPGASPIDSVIGDLSSIGGSSVQPFFDDGTNGDVTAGNNVFSLATTVSAGTAVGIKTLPIVITDTLGRTGTTTITFMVSPIPTCDPTLSISQIQGSGAMSPVAGQLITTEGVVYARRSNGFYIQMAVGDSDSTTSDGVFVFTNATPTSGAAVGNLVCVTGTVSEFVPSADPFQAPLTEIGAPLTVTRLASGQSLPAPIPITTAMTTGSGISAALEALEGMRVTVPSLTVVGPTLGNINEPNATASTTGVFYGVVTGVARPFREAGIDANDPKPTCAAGIGCAIPTFDTNPERLRIVSGLLGAPLLDVNAGTVIAGIVGPLDYGFRTYTIGPESTTTLDISAVPSTAPVPLAHAAEITVGSQNLERFFDDVDDPNIDEPVLTAEAYQRRLTKASRVIREVLRSPDVVSLVEIENQTTVNALAARINQDAVAAGSTNPQYVGFLVEGNDIGGIDVGFLVKSTRITPLAVTQYGKDATFVNPVTGGNDILNDRPPLVLDAMATRPNGDSFLLTVIANHLRSLNDVDTARVQAKRRAQAEFLASLVQDLQSTNPPAKILLVGDFNAFDVNDGFVDVIGTIEGIPSPPDQVAAASADLVNPNLSNLNLLLPPGQRYSYVFDGNAQTLDHALANAALLPWVSDFAYGRSNADFAQSLYGSTSAARLSDHDGSVSFIDLGTPMVTGRIAAAAASPEGDAWVDIEVSNLGTGFAGQVTISEVRFSALKGSAPVVLTSSFAVGSLQAGETRVIRITATLPAGSKFTVMAKGQFIDQSGAVREFVVKPEMFQ